MVKNVRLAELIRNEKEKFQTRRKLQLLARKGI